jgi:hypothetical protein
MKIGGDDIHDHKEGQVGIFARKLKVSLIARELN